MTVLFMIIVLTRDILNGQQLTFFTTPAAPLLKSRMRTDSGKRITFPIILIYDINSSGVTIVASTSLLARFRRILDLSAKNCVLWLGKLKQLHRYYQNNLWKLYTSPSVRESRTLTNRSSYGCMFVFVVGKVPHACKKNKHFSRIVFLFKNDYKLLTF